MLVPDNWLAGCPAISRLTYQLCAVKVELEKHHDVFVNTLKQVFLLEPPTTGDKEDLKKCRNYFESLFSGIGFACTVVKSNDERYGDHLLMEYGEGRTCLKDGFRSFKKIRLTQ